jgi:hypothetical protein
VGIFPRTLRPQPAPERFKKQTTGPRSAFRHWHICCDARRGGEIDLLRAIEDSGIGIWVRESGSVWSYPTIIFLHAVGLTFVAGVNAALDLRLLGFAPRLPVASMTGLFPVMWVGFWINALSGVALLMPMPQR